MDVLRSTEMNRDVFEHPHNEVTGHIQQGRVDALVRIPLRPIATRELASVSDREQ